MDSEEVRGKDAETEANLEGKTDHEGEPEAKTKTRMGEKGNCEGEAETETGTGKEGIWDFEGEAENICKTEVGQNEEEGNTLHSPTGPSGVRGLTRTLCGLLMILGVHTKIAQ